MRPGKIRDGFDFRDAKDSEVGTPLMKLIQGIVIGTQIFRKAGTSNGLLEHPAERQAIDDARLNSKPDDSPRVLVHHDEHPIRSQDDRFASKQVETPQAVLRMADEREPGRTTFRRHRVVILGKNPPNHILINGGTEGQIDLFGDIPRSDCAFSSRQPHGSNPLLAPLDRASFFVWAKTADDTCAAPAHGESSVTSTA